MATRTRSLLAAGLLASGVGGLVLTDASPLSWVVSAALLDFRVPVFLTAQWRSTTDDVLERWWHHVAGGVTVHVEHLRAGELKGRRAAELAARDVGIPLGRMLRVLPAQGPRLQGEGPGSSSIDFARKCYA